VRSRRAWIYVLSVLALLVPAGGIAYLGAFSYQNDRGAVSARTERQKQAAEEITTRIERAIDDAFTAIDTATARVPVPRGPLDAPLARYWFWIDPHGHLVVPHAATAEDEELVGTDRAPCSDRLEECVRQSSQRQARLAKLTSAMRAESCRPSTTETCSGAWAEARHMYATLADFADTGPQAQLGLARVYRLTGDHKGLTATLNALEPRFGDRIIDGLPVKLVVEVMRAGGNPVELVGIERDIIAGKYDLAPVVAIGVLTRIRAAMSSGIGLNFDQERAALDLQIAALRTEARAAAGLADDVPDVVRDATPAWHGRPATRQPARTLIYKRRSDGSVIGFAVDALMLEEAAGHDTRDGVAVNARAIVLPVGSSPPPALRQLAQVPFGENLPHLALHLVNPVDDPDPLDEVIRARSKRHVAYTSGLAVLLGLGLLATIFGAARARELARLKSDFVSTVSHELKTPLTSIRMFAEMLEQGVAQGDTGKMARYHHVIVQESQRLGLLIANLLDYAQIERGTRRYTLTRENVGKLARDAVSTFETLQDPEKARRNPVAVEVSSGAMSTSVEVDRDVVIQALLNLLANAAKYGAVGSTRDVNPIEVTVDADARSTSISVRDHGPGIPAHEQARIFREFYRAPEAYTSGIEGTGLGLALVKQHVEGLGGTVDVHSVVGQGATFTIRLPRHDSAKEAV
jgi:signal transduction histidine kinase